MSCKVQRYLVAWWNYSNSKFLVIDAANAGKAKRAAQQRLCELWDLNYGCGDPDLLPDYPVTRMSAVPVEDLTDGAEIWGAPEGGQHI